METRRRRSPLRILAPVALIAFAVALAMIISSASKDDGGGGGPSSSAAEKARDLGTSTGTTKTRKKRSRDKLPQSVYIVKSGDTLGSIAEKTGIPVQRLQDLNPGLDQFSLVAGQKIKLR
jgi:LysM repeat protein